MGRKCVAAASISFEIWEGRGSGSTKFRFFQGNFREISIFSGNFTKNFDFFPGKFVKNFNSFRQIFEKCRFFSGNLKNFDFPGTNCSFTATSEQIIIFLFKSHHFRLLTAHNKI